MAAYREDCCCVVCGVVFALLVASAFPVTQITLGAVYLHECPAGPAIPLYELVSGVVGLLVIGQAVLWKILPTSLKGRPWVIFVLCFDLFVVIWFLYGSYHIYVIYQPSFTKPPTVEPAGLNHSISSWPAATPDPGFQSPNETLSHFNQTWQTDVNLTSSVPPANSSGGVPAGRPSAQMSGHMTDDAPYCNRILYLFAFWTTTLVYGFTGLGLVIASCCYGCVLLMRVLTSCMSP